VVWKKIKGAGVDHWFKELKPCSDVSEDTLSTILGVHEKLSALFNEMTGFRKISLASKYLHFHFRHLFFIYDSRAAQALSKLGICCQRGNTYPVADNEYRKFCEKCLMLRAYIEKEYGKKLTPREIDNLLLRIEREGAINIALAR